MRNLLRLLITAVLLSSAPLAAAGPISGPLRVHPENPRYFADGSGRAIFLVGSHTWANFQERGVEGQTPDFDYEAYLDFLVDHGHNFMRMWRWEHAKWMQFVSDDTPIRYAPMAYMRTGPGNALDGKPRFDLTKFNQAYFERMRERVVAAGKRGIYVSVMLFQGFSIEQKGTKGVDPKKGNAWEGHPFNAKNNINGVNGDINGNGEGEETHTLASPEVLRLQEAYVRKVIDTLNDLDNVLYEVSNESHAASTKWQYHIIKFVKKYEQGKAQQHPVGMSFQWGRNKGTNANLFESPADWICPNGGQFLSDPPASKGSKIVIVDTDHIKPWDSDPSWVWKNLLRGNHFILMDSYRDFRIGAPAQIDSKHEPTRAAMGYARRLTETVALHAMAPTGDAASTGYCLADPGREYLVYRPAKAGPKIRMKIAAGRYTATWIDASNSKHNPLGTVKVEGGEHSFVLDGKRPMLLHLKRK